MGKKPRKTKRLGEQLSAYLDGELSPSQMNAVERRLQRDPEAKARLEELRQTVDEVRRLPRELAPASLVNEVLEKLERRHILGDDPWVSQKTPWTWPRLRSLLAVAAMVIFSVSVGLWSLNQVSRRSTPIALSDATRPMEPVEIRSRAAFDESADSAAARSNVERSDMTALSHAQKTQPGNLATGLLSPPATHDESDALRHATAPMRHSGASRNPALNAGVWTPAFAGVTEAAPATASIDEFATPEPFHADVNDAPTEVSIDQSVVLTVACRSNSDLLACQRSITQRGQVVASSWRQMVFGDTSPTVAPTEYAAPTSPVAQAGTDDINEEVQGRGVGEELARRGRFAGSIAIPQTEILGVNLTIARSEVPELINELAGPSTSPRDISLSVGDVISVQGWRQSQQLAQMISAKGAKHRARPLPDGRGSERGAADSSGPLEQMLNSLGIPFQPSSHTDHYVEPPAAKQELSPMRESHDVITTESEMITLHVRLIAPVEAIKPPSGEPGQLSPR